MTVIRRAAELVALAALTLAMAAPAYGAGARSSLPAWACAPGESGGSLARGGIADSRGVIREKDTGQVARDMPASAKGKAPAGDVIVPVVWHVIHDGVEGDVSDRDIAVQIRVLNVTFGGGEGGDDTGFSFDLVDVTRTDNARWYAIRSAGAEHEMKQALKTGGDETLNVYSTSGGAYLGWAYLPEITDTAQAYLDGIVIDWRTMKGVSDAYQDAFDEGETLTHEAGHWFNLEHTFYGQCNKNGDFVDDTPPQKTPTSGCPEGKDTCPAPGTDPIHNYMDYSFDDCYTEFTPGQTQRMHDAWLLYRA